MRQKYVRTLEFFIYMKEKYCRLTFFQVSKKVLLIYLDLQLFCKILVEPKNNSKNTMTSASRFIYGNFFLSSFTKVGKLVPSPKKTLWKKTCNLIHVHYSNQSNSN